MSFGRRFHCFLFIFLILPVFLQGQSPDEKNLIRAITSLSEYSIPFEKRSLLANYGGFGSSLLVGNPAAPNEVSGAFVLAVPLYADFAVDTALALAKISAFSHDLQPNRNILVAFLGDERNELPRDFGGLTHKGFRDLLTLADLPENWVLCYLDAHTEPEELLIRNGAREYVAPLEIIRTLPEFFRAAGIRWSFRIRYNEIYKLGLVEGPEPLIIGWEEEINSFVLSEGTVKRGVSKKVQSEELAEILFNYSGTLSFPVLNADRHYSTFSFPGNRFFSLSEEAMVILLLFTAGIVLVIFLIYSARYNAIIHFHIRLFMKSSWIFIILLPLLVLSIKVSGLLYSMLFSALGPPLSDGVNTMANYTGTGLTVILAVLLFYLPSPLLDFFHFPKRAQFYGFSAVIFVIIGMAIAAFLDFSYVPVFMWAFLFIFLGSYFNNPFLVFICAFLSPLFAIGALINILETGAPRITELLISPYFNTLDSWIFTTQIALLSLPLFLLAKRGFILLHIFYHRGLRSKPKRIYRLITIPAFIIVVTVSILVQIRLIPRDQIPPERKFMAGSPGGILDMSIQDTLFQDSRILTVHLEAKGKPVRFDVELQGKNGNGLLPVYSATVPFSREHGEEKIIFSLGEYAPNPLNMEIVVPKNFDGLLAAAALYNVWDGYIDREGVPRTEDYILKVSRIIDLEPK